MNDTDAPHLDPAGTLAMVEGQQRATGEALDVNPRLIYGAWGVAWLVGFGVLWLTGRGPAGDFRVPPAWAFIAFGASLLAALAVTAIQIVRASRGIQGPSTQTSAMYEWSWLLGFASLGALNAGLSRLGASDEIFAAVSVFAPSLLVGILYLSSAALWRDRVQFGLGAWIIVVASIGVVVGVPSIYAVMALAGGGGFLLAAVWFTARR